MLAPAVAGPSRAAQRAQLAAAVAVYQEKAGVPAVSVYVDQGGNPLYRADEGRADVAENRAVGPDSIYAIGSITKSFTAHAVLTLVAAGRLSSMTPWAAS